MTYNKKNNIVKQKIKSKILWKQNPVSQKKKITKI